VRKTYLPASAWPSGYIMEFLVLMKLREEGVGKSDEENRKIVKEAIVPSIEMLIKMEKDGMLSGGFFEGQRAAAFVMSVQDEEAIDNTMAALPWAAIFDVEIAQLEPLKEALARDLKVAQGSPAKPKSGKKAKALK
jgi:hypothetical protein